MCFSFKEIWAMMAVNMGQMETMMLTFDAVVNDMAAFSVN